MKKRVDDAPAAPEPFEVGFFRPDEAQSARRMEYKPQPFSAEAEAAAATANSIPQTNEANER